jgi:hypothetical protein
MLKRIAVHVTPVLAALVAGSWVSAEFVGIQEPPPIMIVNFMKVPPGMAGDYVQFETEIFKPIHEDRIQHDEMESWHLYGVRFPSGAEAPYDFVTIDVYSTWDQSEGIGARPWREIISAVHPDMDLQELPRRIREARTVAQSQLWRKIDEAK